MIKLTGEGQSGALPPSFAYAGKFDLAAHFILPVTRYLRAVNTEKYIVPAQRHLDIGCGDGYFLQRSRCEERFGLDPLMGDKIEDRLDFPDDHFDYVTMLAVIEHIADPMPLLREIARILKPGGKWVATTPKYAADRLIRLYVRHVAEHEHEVYYDLESFKALTEPLFEMVGHHTFIFGLNQVFCLKKHSNKDG